MSTYLILVLFLWTNIRTHGERRLSEKKTGWVLWHFRRWENGDFPLKTKQKLKQKQNEVSVNG